MSTHSIPNNLGQIRQSNRGDIYGELWSTYNIDLNTNPGKIKSSKKLAKAFNLGADQLEAVQVHDGFFCIAFEDALYRCDTGSDPRVPANWTLINALGSIGQFSDTVSFDGDLLISGSALSGTTDIALYNGSSVDDDWWTDVISGTALKNSVPHIMDVQRTGRDTLFVTDGNLIRYYNTNSLHTTITLEEQFVACSLAPALDATFVGTYTEGEDIAFVYEIRVGDDIAFNSYPVDGRAALSMCTVGNVPYVVTDRGHIQVFDGAGFKTVASFPFATEAVEALGVIPGQVQASNTSRMVHPKGMRSRDGIIYINIATGVTPYDNRSHAGVWEFNTQTGVLHHRYSIANDADQAGIMLQDRSAPIAVVMSRFTRLLTGGNSFPEFADAAAGAVYAEADEPQVSAFVTPEYSSDTIQQAWEKVAMMADTLADGDSIEMKYRVRKRPDYPHTILTTTWFNATQLLSSDSIWADVDIGDEIEILDGYGAGRTCHVTAIAEGTANYTITIDREIGVLNEQSVVRLDSWKLMTDTYNAENEEYFTWGTDEVNYWIQFKVILNGNVCIRKMLTKGNSKTQL
jgi:hypothetical protein